MGEPARLAVDGRPVGPVVVLTTARERGRGLLGRDGLEGAVLLRPCRSVHTLGMRFRIDVAFLDTGQKVLRTVTLARNRPGVMAWRAAAALEAEAGSFERWGLVPGSRLSVTEGDPVAP